MGGNVASWKAVKIPVRLRNQGSRRMVREKAGEVGRDERAQSLVATGRELSCPLRSNRQSLKWTGGHNQIFISGEKTKTETKKTLAGWSLGNQDRCWKGKRCSDFNLGGNG